MFCYDFSVSQKQQRKPTNWLSHTLTTIALSTAVLRSSNCFPSNRCFSELTSVLLDVVYTRKIKKNCSARLSRNWKTFLFRCCWNVREINDRNPRYWPGSWNLQLKALSVKKVLTGWWFNAVSYFAVGTVSRCCRQRIFAISCNFYYFHVLLLYKICLKILPSISGHREKPVSIGHCRFSSVVLTTWH